MMNEKATIYDYMRMCKAFEDCKDCPLDKNLCHITPFNKEELDEVNEIVINWSKEHPAKTRQDKFLEMFPNAKIYTDGVLKIKPCYIDEGVKCDGYADCLVCRDKYWLAEVEENEQ